ncbi:MAG: GUN4 N-terminal ARM-like repeat domain-containing protein [Cyanobacteria bacterium P01_D01_bin.1]
MSSNATEIDTLTVALTSDSLKKQLQAIYELSQLDAVGDRILVDFLKTELIEQKNMPTAVHGSTYQRICASSLDLAQSIIHQYWPDGLLKPQSALGIDYSELQTLLIQQDYQSADKLTMQKLCELAGERAIARKWIYFTEVNQLPATDLQTIDTLWRLYSEDRFGWSKQRELWIRLGKDWERLWTQLVWKSVDGAWTRYPTEFVWDLSAPVGHLPLSNQLRGVRMMDSLLSHPAWDPV